jgi:hypothetical protein
VGVCRVACDGHRDCGEGGYCSENGACREGGACYHPLDCDIAQNDYLRLRCRGYGNCVDGTCGWICGPEACRDLTDVLPWLGFCERLLGYAVVDGQCQAVRGCDDLGLGFFEDMRTCEGTCGG